MSSLNKVCLIGNLGKDPEIRTLNNGNRVASFSLALTETWRDKTSGEKKERTEWANVVVFNDNLVKVIENYVKKGDKLYVEGSMQTRKYEKDGVDRYTTEVVIQSFNGQIVLLGGSKSDATDNYSGPAGKAKATESYDLNDDIPF